MKLVKLGKELLTKFSIVDLKANRDILVFFVFLLVSSAFWLLNAMRDSYITELSYPVTFVNVPPNKAIVSVSSNQLNFRLRANGYSILRHHIAGLFSPVELDVSRALNLTHSQTNATILLSRYFRNEISEKFIGSEILDMSPDSFFITLDSVVSRKVPVKHAGNLSFQQQFHLAGPVMFEPDSILVTGQFSKVDTILHVVNVPFEALDLNDTLSKHVNLAEINAVDFSQPRVKITIPVELFSEKALMVPIDISGLPDTLRLKTFPSGVNVTFRIGLSNFHEIDASYFRAVVDAGDIFRNAEMPKRLRVRLEKVPAGILLVDFNPLFVEYLVERPR